jgi:YegS/Rv2252/BmrU family lipid kinase
MALLKSIGLDFQHDWTEAPGHARELAQTAIKKGSELVVSVGGDGTVNEVANGLYDSGNTVDVMLGIISTGTGCDYIRTVGIPRACREACQCLTSPRKLAVDVGAIEYISNDRTIKRLFVNFAGLGFDTEIVKATTQRFKALSSKPSYLMGLLTTLLSYKNKRISLTVDGEKIEKKVCTVLINNGRYGGGGMFTAPEAELTDGLLDTLIIGDLSKPDLLWSLPRVYRGTHLTHPKVTLKKAKEIEINSAESLFLQADGELLGELPARFRVLPATLNLAV